tara:strand:- start:367 stop:672 length:306 start_codon:yes stop_codon:yes gene_type:complete
MKLKDYTRAHLQDLLIGLFTNNLSESQKEWIKYTDQPVLDNGTKISLKFAICLELLNKHKVNPHDVIKGALNQIARDAYAHAEAAANIKTCPENAIIYTIS